MNALWTISQAGILLLGATAVLLVAMKNKWGFVVGLASQPFWITAAILDQQWGVLATSLLYVFSWSYGVYNWFWPSRVRDRALRQHAIEHGLYL